MHNHVTKEEVAIPRDFHYLKVIKFGSGFSSGDYKLTFCNVLGNEFLSIKNMTRSIQMFRMNISS
ncbi:MAG: hypothetical protein ACR5K3_01135 [Wolbachia sp.]